MESCRLKFTNVKQIGGSTLEVGLQQGIIVGMFGREHQAGVITHLNSKRQHDNMCAARAFYDCPAIISHRPRSQNILIKS
jgi:hypothetical protein